MQIFIKGPFLNKKQEKYLLLSVFGIFPLNLKELLSIRTLFYFRICKVSRCLALDVMSLRYFISTLLWSLQVLIHAK